MMRRFIARCALGVIVALAPTAPALAGCCRVITLDALPAQVIAGQPIHIDFMVRVNRELMDDLPPTIQAHRLDSGESFTVTAEAAGTRGHYAATLTFPSVGVWQWSIDNQPMPELTVLASAPPNSVGIPLSLPLIAGALGLIGAGGGALLVSRRKRVRFVPALVLVSVLISVTGFASAANGLSPSTPHTDPGKLGWMLFIAKGCIVCHHHEATSGVFESYQAGPDLTNAHFDPAFLRRWLNEPSSVRPNTIMPTFGLSDDEIEALIAFINAP